MREFKWPCEPADIELLAILKADAYGHGLDICAWSALRACWRWLGVTSVEEGVAVREMEEAQKGDDELSGMCDILVIGGVFSGQAVDVVDHQLVPVIWESWQLDELETYANRVRPVQVHLELDTGMSRQGVTVDDGGTALRSMLDRIRQSPAAGLGGVMTHLYGADESDGVSAAGQLRELEKALTIISAAGLPEPAEPRWLHVGNSAALLAGDMPGGVMQELRRLCRKFGMRGMMRPGLALYGLAPEFDPDEPASVTSRRRKLRRVLTWKTQVVGVREIAAGQVVGYNGTFVATEPMRVALLAVGYADGLKRGLSNRGAVLVRGQQAPIIGRISMDQTVVDVSGIAGVAAGDEVVLIGRQGGRSITAEDHARWAGTIPWEIFTSITQRVERRAID
jgi:alanine racemase